MVGAMAGCRDGGEADAAGGETLAIEEGEIRNESPVAVARQGVHLEQVRRPAEPVRSGEPQRRLRLLLEPRGQGRVILVSVGEKDRFDRPSVDGRPEGCKMPRIVRPWIEDGDPLVSENE